MGNYKGIVVVVGLLLSPCVSWAQGVSILPPDAKAGDRLTVRTTAGESFGGRLAGEHGDVLLLAAEGGERRIPTANVEQVDRHRNRMLFGPVIGLAAGLTAGLPLKSLVDNETGGGTRYLISMVALGVGVGTVVDLFTRSDRTVYRRGASSLKGLEVQPHRSGAAIQWGTTW